MHRLRTLVLGAVAAATVALAPSAAHADGVNPPFVPVGANQFFAGIVNGDEGTATIKVVCPVPVTPEATGHPEAGQIVAARQILPPVPVNMFGYTGTEATGIAVGFGATSVTAPLILHYYGIGLEIPQSLNLPCTGTGVVTFTPVPGSNTARPATVTVTYVPTP